MRANAKLLGMFSGVLFLSLAANSAPNQSSERAKQPCKDANTQREMNECLASAYRDSDRELNVFYASLRKKLGASDAARLQGAQRAWIAYRDTNCSAETALYQGGSMQPAVHSGCLERMTRSRIAELHAIYETGNR